MMGAGMGLGMLIFMMVFFCLLLLVSIASSTSKENTYIKHKRKPESYDNDDDYFFPDEKLKHGQEMLLSDDGELLEIVDG
jgi:hypothetical protein